MSLAEQMNINPFGLKNLGYLHVYDELCTIKGEGVEDLLAYM